MTAVSTKGFLLLLFLAAIVAYATVVSYRAILSYDIFYLDDTMDPPSYSKRGAKKKKGKAFKAAKAATAIRIRDFVPPPPPPEVLEETAPRGSKIDFESVAKKWELPDGSIDLLKEIQSRTIGFDYNQTTDILALRHPLKTGGTSFSIMMKNIFGDRVIPGSGPSVWWNDEKFTKALEKHKGDDEDDPYWRNMAVMYTHTILRPTSGVKLLDKIRSRVPALEEKRFRLMTIVRRPLDLAASSFYETQCRIGKFANQRNLKGKECPPVNLTDVMYKNIEFWTHKCEEEYDWKTKKCQAIQNKGGEKVYAHCGSVDVLLDETNNVHNMMHKTLMGDFPRPPELGVNETDSESEINLTPTLEEVSLYTLRDLGGLIDYNPVHKEDFVWFAITERFSESMCLFYYHFEIEPVEEKTSLMKKCRPLAFWTEEQKQKFIDKEDFSYTVWRAANAIMDVRTEDMRLEIKARLDAGEKLEDMPFVAPGCYGEEEEETDKEMNE